MPSHKHFPFRLLVAGLFVPLGLPTVNTADAAPQRKIFIKENKQYLKVEVLHENLVHFEASAMPVPQVDQPVYTSPMVAKTDFPGATHYSTSNNGNTLETGAMRIDIDPASLCLTLADKQQGGKTLTRICPNNLENSWKGIQIDANGMDHVYGLGQQLQNPGQADGDRRQQKKRVGQGELGNDFVVFGGGMVGNVQIPVYFATGSDGRHYALFMDNVYKQDWSFEGSTWNAAMYGDQLRWYLITGPDLKSLRSTYMDLTGRPPVPPRKSFGLWVSEFGYDNWEEIDTLRQGLRNDGFPVDGFVLDLNWFGGINTKNENQQFMGLLDWDQNQSESLKANHFDFTNPDQHIKDLHQDHVGLTVIEESYLNKNTDTYSEMPGNLSAYQRTGGVCDARQQKAIEIEKNDFWGKGHMMDWSDPQAGAWIHNNRRYPNLSMKGVHAHWTDLGEPETRREDACYEGLEQSVNRENQPELKNHHSDIHNLYNLLWNRSIWNGYWNHREDTDNLGVKHPRPFIVSRSGAAGTQRFGTAMWSGDIGSHVESLAAHANSQMHMSFSGIDYYGADIGGFRKSALPFNDDRGSYRNYENELYTQWFAYGSWFDVPVRPHVDNEFVSIAYPYATAPNKVGHKESNLANIRQRYQLIPYYYSLAYRAFLEGEPVIPPPIFYFSDDATLAQIGNQKMVGDSIMVGMVAAHGEYERNLYLPKGRWSNFNTHEWLTSQGEYVNNLPVYRDGLLRLPAFVKAGAILPMMNVNDQTKDAFDHQRAGGQNTDLMMRVYADQKASQFTLYEDDGTTISSYDSQGNPSYRYVTTLLHQQQVSDTQVKVTVDPSKVADGGSLPSGVPSERSIIVELVVENARGMEVLFQGQPLSKRDSRMALDQAASGWVSVDDRWIVAKVSPTIY
ncbi:MAG: DUF5110 domain-containing protein [Magnetococcus sp. THC-1_WYH]